MTQNKMDFDGLMIDLIRRITSTEFMFMVGILISIILPPLIPSLPTNMQETAVITLGASSTLYTILRQVFKIKQLQNSIEIKEVQKRVENTVELINQVKEVIKEVQKPKEMDVNLNTNPK